MFRVRPAGVESDVRPVTEDRRDATAAGVRERAAGLLARIVQFVVGVVVLIIVAGILLVVLKANPSNSIVSEVHDWAGRLAGPFVGMFSFRSASDALAVNWGIAAAVYLLVGIFVTRLVGRTYRYTTLVTRPRSGEQ